MSTRQAGGPRWAVLAGLLFVTAGACTGVTHTGVPSSKPTTATAGTQTSPATPSPTFPNPFKIIARYSPGSLGLRTLPAGLALGGGFGNDVAIGPDGNVYVTDWQGQTVTVVSANGKVLRRWGKPGHGPGEFTFEADVNNNPLASIAIGPDGNVYVSDSGNARVQIFSPTGSFIRQFGGTSGGQGNYQFEDPYDLVVDAGNNVYMVDHTPNTLSKFSPSGRLVWRVGGLGDPDHDLRGEFHLASLDPHGRIVMTGGLPGSILYMDHNGHKVDVLPTTEDFPAPRVGPCDVTVDSAGNTFVTSCGGPFDAPTAVPPYQFELVYDRNRHLIGAWYDSPFIESPRFGPHGEAFAFADDGSLLKLKVTLPGA